ncbi:MAG: GIY-YIG nuclease family protein [Terriglobia bacterium]
MWYVYCLRCRDGSVYTGITSDLKRRLDEHNQGKGGAYTQAKRPVELVYQESHPDKSSALRRELEIKRWTRPRKLALIAG